VRDCEWLWKVALEGGMMFTRVVKNRQRTHILLCLDAAFEMIQMETSDANPVSAKLQKKQE
jgi:hypothetical protein